MKPIAEMWQLVQKQNDRHAAAVSQHTTIAIEVNKDFCFYEWWQL